MVRAVVRIVFGVAAVVLLWAVGSWMVRLSWEIDAVIALAAVFVFAFYFEREEPAAADGSLTKTTQGHEDHEAL